MPLETRPDGEHNGRLTPAVVTFFIIGLIVFAQSVQFVSADNTGADTSSLTMNFHMHSLVFRVSESVFIYNGADTGPPTYATPVTTPVSCSSSSSEFQQFLPQSAQAWSSGNNVWFGVVSWVTQPLDEDLTIRGNANMTVWMSSSDTDVAESGYVFGVSESDSMANVIGEPVYEYHLGKGSVLKSTPSLHRLAFNVDRTFTKGNLIAFFVGVWSTTEGWQYQVYFDSPTANSFAELPVASVPVPEFSQMGILVSVSFAVLSSYMLIRRSRPFSSSR
jgi:hypothetical protein